MFTHTINPKNTLAHWSQKKIFKCVNCPPHHLHFSKMHECIHRIYFQNKFFKHAYSQYIFLPLKCIDSQFRSVHFEKGNYSDTFDTENNVIHVLIHFGERKMWWTMNTFDVWRLLVWRFFFKQMGSMCFYVSEK